MRSRVRKVLHVLNGAAGGATLSAIGLMEELANHGLESCAVCADFGFETTRQRLREATNGQVQFIPLYWWTKKARIALWKRPLLEMRQIARTGWARGSALRVAKFAHEMDVDLIHTSTIVTPEGASAARLLGKPHVWHVREMIGPGQTHRLPLEGRALGPFLARRASSLVANSRATAQCIESWLPEGLLHVIPNGIDVRQFGHIEFRGSKQRTVVVGMVANMSSQWKKHELFIECAALMKPRPGIEFRLYGDDPGNAYANRLRAKVNEMGLGTTFRFMGHVPDPVEIMEGIDILVQPSNGESFGRVVVEAMAAGRPVVANRGGPSAELVDDDVSGFVTDERDDAADLARLVTRVLDDEDLRERLGASGRARAAKHFSLAACANRVLDTYELSVAKPLSPWR